jgi:hypothetical protein
MREREADKILDNIIQLAELLDEEALRNAEGIHFIELARSVSLKKSRKAHGHNSMSLSRPYRHKEKRTATPLRTVGRNTGHT